MEDTLMREIALGFLIATATLLIAPNQTLGHHGTGISYEMTVKPIRLTGTVKEYRWANPHVFIFLEVKNQTGKVEEWTFEGDSPYNWARVGGNKNTIKPGDQVTVSFYASKVKDAHVGVVNKVILAEGKEVLQFEPDEPRPPAR
jgi:uncharacterized protein DUF6152